MKKGLKLYCLVSPLSRLTSLTGIMVTTLCLTACSGGGGGSSTTIPSPTYPPAQPISLSPTVLSGTLKQQTTTKATSAWASGYRGQGITIAVVDSGVNPNHVDFYDDSGYSRINWQDAKSIEYDLQNDTLIYSNDYRDIDAPIYHGTHVSSIALGREYGVAPEATLLPINVFLDKSSAYNTAIYAGVDYAASRAPIINTSISDMVNLSNQGSSSPLSSYTSTLRNNATALVAAAGNGNTIGNDEVGDPIGAEHFNNNTVENLAIQPGIENQVLSVIALNDSGVRASFSDYPGSCANVIGGCNGSDAATMTAIQNSFISAPGVNVMAAYGGSDTGSRIYSGTSMSAPAVSGGLALLLSSWNQLTIQQAVQILKDTADTSFAWYTAAEYGVGLMDIQAALTPVGTLKSSSSTSTTTSYSLGSSTATLPAAFTNLSTLSALQSVAYFDDYNRDFMVDIRPTIHIKKQPLNWENFWQNLPSQPDNITQFAGLTLTTKFDHSQTNPIKALKVTYNHSALAYTKNSSANLLETSLTPSINQFYSNKQQTFGTTFTLQQSLTPKLSMLLATQNEAHVFDKPTNNVIKTKNQRQTLAVQYTLAKGFALGLSTQFQNEKDGFMGFKGKGALSFGEQNLSQLNSLTAHYTIHNIQLFGLWQQGNLLKSQKSKGSYIKLNQAKMGQLKLGLTQTLRPGQIWGIQTYNYNTLLQTNIALTLPTGVNASGIEQQQTTYYQKKNNIQLDTLELFFKSVPKQGLQYQVNVIHTPEDAGAGVQLNAYF